MGVQVDRLSSKLKNTFPKRTKEEKRLFNLLKSAYTEARYNMAYKITKKELKYLAGRVTTLRDLTEKICKAKIKSFTK